jgi:hypothetical protein
VLTLLLPHVAAAGILQGGGNSWHICCEGHARLTHVLGPQMFDANDTEAEEGYAHQGGDDGDDDEEDGDYTEAQENNTFATPAGSQAGDHEDHHAIGGRPVCSVAHMW